MPNGRPGDHPLTDMLHHKMPSMFPDDVFDAVVALSKHPRFAEIEDRVSTLLWDNWPWWGNVTPDLARVRKELEVIRGELNKET